MPKISIVLPTYNQAQYLPAALDSVFAQSERDFELIVVNDGSTDATPQVLADYRSRYSFTLVDQANRGLPEALNVGFARASGDYLTWTSSDNVMQAQMLSALRRALDEAPGIGMVYADWWVIDEVGRVIGLVRTLNYDRLLLFRTNYINACFMYRRACHERVGAYRAELRGSEDWDYWLRIARHFPLRRVPQPLYQYRVHGASLTASPEASRYYAPLATYWRQAEPLAWHASRIWYHSLKLMRRRAPVPVLQAAAELSGSAIEGLAGHVG